MKCIPPLGSLSTKYVAETAFKVCWVCIEIWMKYEWRGRHLYSIVVGREEEKEKKEGTLSLSFLFFFTKRDFSLTRTISSFKWSNLKKGNKILGWTVLYSKYPTSTLIYFSLLGKYRMVWIKCQNWRDNSTLQSLLPSLLLMESKCRSLNEICSPLSLSIE